MGYIVEDHFINKNPVVTAIYKRIIAECQQFGQVKQVAKKTSIHLDAKAGFAGVYTRKNYLLLKIHTDFEIDSERIEKSERISTNRFKHTVKLTDPIDVDQQICHWLKAAYELKS